MDTICLTVCLSMNERNSVSACVSVTPPNNAELKGGSFFLNSMYFIKEWLSTVIFIYLTVYIF